MSRAPIWYFDKVLGLVIFAVGMAMLILPAMALQAFWDSPSAVPALYWWMGGCGLFSMLAGIVVFQRAGWG